MREKAEYPSQLVVDFLRLVAWVISKTFWFVRYEGREHIPANDSEAFLIASNHQTYVDPVWICLPMRRHIRYMAFDKAFGWRFVGPLISYLGAFPVSPDVGDSRKAIKEALRTLHGGGILTVFPEGGREFADGEMLPFKDGAVRIARQAGVPVLPVTITGGNRIWPREQKYPRLFKRARIEYHPLIRFGKSKDDDLEQMTEHLRLVIASGIANDQS